jgi:hypothetical protein
MPDWWAAFEVGQRQACLPGRMSPRFDMRWLARADKGRLYGGLCGCDDALREARV